MFVKGKWVWQQPTRYKKSYQVVSAVIKRWNFSLKDMCTILDDIKALIDEQQENVQKAFIQFPNPYTVRPEFKKYVIQDYFSLDNKARTLGRKKDSINSSKY